MAIFFTLYVRPVAAKIVISRSIRCPATASSSICGGDFYKHLFEYHIPHLTIQFVRKRRENNRNRTPHDAKSLVLSEIPIIDQNFTAERNRRLRAIDFNEKSRNSSLWSTVAFRDVIKFKIWTRLGGGGVYENTKFAKRVIFRSFTTGKGK